MECCEWTSDPNLEWKVAFSQFAHPAINAVSVVGRVGPAFLLAATMFGFVIQLSNLVTEKELRLRQVCCYGSSTFTFFSFEEHANTDTTIFAGQRTSNSLPNLSYVYSNSQFEED